MNLFSGMAPNDVIKAIIAGLLGLVALACGIGVVLDIVRWYTGGNEDDPQTESPRPVVAALKGRMITVLAIGFLAGGGGAAVASGIGSSAGSTPSETIGGQGPGGWQVPGTAGGGGSSLGDALAQAAEQRPGLAGDLDRAARADATSAVDNSAGAADAFNRGDTGGVAGAAASAYGDLIKSFLERTGSNVLENPGGLLNIPGAIGQGFAQAVWEYLKGVKEEIEKRGRS